MGDDARIVIDGNARGAVAALDQVGDAVRRTSTALAQMGARANTDARGWTARADSINAWKRAASGVAPQMTGILDSFEEFAEGASKVGGKAMVARAGILALGTAWTAAAAVTVAAGAAMVASSVEVVTNLKAYSGVAMRHREALEDAAMATGTLHREVTELRVEIAGQMAPAIEQFSYAMAGVVDATGDAVSGVHDLTQAFGVSARDIAGFVPVIGDVLRLYDQIADRGRQAQADAAAAAMGAAAAAQIRAGMSPKFNMEADAAAAARAQAEADAMMLVAQSYERTATAVRSSTTAHQEAAPVIDKAIEQAMALAQRQQTQWQILTDLDKAERDRADAIMSQVAGTDNVSSGSFGIDPAGTDKARNDSIAAAGAVSSAWASSAQSIVGAFAATANAVIGLSSDMADGQVRSSEKMSARQRQELRDQWRRQKASALASASIQAALGFVTTLASVPYPVNLVLAALGAVASGVQIAKIANTPPPNIAHTGAVLAPDERDVSVRMLASERLAVIPARGGMTSGDMARNATGEAPSTAAAPRVYIVTPDAGLQRTRPYAGMRPGMGWAMAG